MKKRIKTGDIMHVGRSFTSNGKIDKIARIVFHYDYWVLEIEKDHKTSTMIIRKQIDDPEGIYFWSQVFKYYPEFIWFG